MPRPTRARIHLDNLRHNAAVAAGLAPDSRLMAVVKADGYGHGAESVAAALDDCVAAFAVASLEEAVRLRDCGIRRPILLLEGVFEASELAEAAAIGAWIMQTCEEQLRWLQEATLSQTVTCWLKVDTGMHRLGVAPQRAPAFLQALRDTRNTGTDTVLCTHFSRADELARDETREQLACFLALCDGLGCLRSAANSPAVLAWPETHLDWIRPGYMLYGDSPFREPLPEAAALKPVMTLESKVIGVRDIPAGDAVGYGATWRAARPSRIATVTAGYGDGYPRTADNGTPVLVNGQRVPLVGRVSMDMLTVDVTDIAAVHVGDPVTLWGEGLPVGEVARHASTIGYELVTRMPARVPREVCA